MRVVLINSAFIVVFRKYSLRERQLAWHLQLEYYLYPTGLLKYHDLPTFFFHYPSKLGVVPAPNPVPSYENLIAAHLLNR